MQPQETSTFSAISPKSTKKPNISLVIIIILSLALIGSVLVWKPWMPNIKTSDRIISVTGTATITAAPDKYTFSPSYDVTSSSQQTALSSLASKSTDLVTKIKTLGVPSSDIQTNSSGYSNNSYYIPVQSKDGTYTYTLNLTVIVNSESLAQKVQDYLVTTGPTGDISPSVDFSNAKTISLQNTARTQAEKDARSKADQSATNLGFKVDRVKSVVDGSLDSGYATPLLGDSISSGANQATATPQLSVQPGQNDLSYSVSIVYYIH